MTGVEAVSKAHSLEDIILREMAGFEKFLKKVVHPDSSRRASALLAIWRDILVFRGHIKRKPGAPYEFEGYEKLPLNKEDFNVNVLINQKTSGANLIDSLSRYIDQRQKKGLLKADEVPLGFRRFMRDLSRFASAPRVEWGSAEYKETYPANIVPLHVPFKTQTQMQFQPAAAAYGFGAPSLPRALTPEEIEQERQADVMAAALAQVGVSTDDTLDTRDFTAPAAQNYGWQKPLDLSFLASEDDTIPPEYFARAYPDVDTPSPENSADISVDDAADTLERVAAELRDETGRMESEAQPLAGLAAVSTIREQEPAAPEASVRAPVMRGDMPEDALDIEQTKAFVSSRWEKNESQRVPDYSGIAPTTKSSGYLAAAGAFAVTAGIGLVSRYALVAAATSLGAAALPAGIAAGIAIGAARTYYKNRHEIMKQASLADTRWGKFKIMAGGIRQSFSPAQIGTTIAASVAGAIGADWVVDNADWLMDKGGVIAQHAADYFTQTKDMAVAMYADLENGLAVSADYAAAAKEHVVAVYNQVAEGLAASAEALTGDAAQSVPFGEIEPRVVTTIPTAADGTPLSVVAERLEARMGAVEIPAASEQVLARLQEIGQESMDRFSGVETTVQETAAPIVAEAAMVEATPIEASVIAAADTLDPVAADPMMAEAVFAPVDAAPVADTASDILVGEDITGATPLQTTTHVVEKGDRNLWRIAQDIFGVKGAATQGAVEAIIAQNPDLIANPNKLSLGQELVIPVSLEDAPRADCQWTRRALTCTP